MKRTRKTFERGEVVRAKSETWEEWADAVYEGEADSFAGWHYVRFVAGGSRRCVPLRRLEKKGATDSTAKKRRRSNGVAGANYVTHIAYTDRTLCGRMRSRVNCQGEMEVVTEGTCLECAKVARGGKVESAAQAMRGNTAVGGGRKAR